MAFEAEVVVANILNWFLEVDVHDRTSTFDAADCEAFPVCEAREGADCIFKRRLDHCQGFEVVLCNLLKVPNMQPLFRVSSDHDRESEAHVVHWLANPGLSNLVRSSVLNAEELDRRVPTSGDKHDLVVEDE